MGLLRPVPYIWTAAEPDAIYTPENQTWNLKITGLFFIFHTKHIVQRRFFWTRNIWEAKK